jgi:hypothetical protein
LIGAEDEHREWRGDEVPMATTKLDRLDVAAGNTRGSGFGLTTAGRRRTLLASVILVAIGLAALLGQPRPALLADPELAFVLRGMGMIKAAIAMAVLALVWWRAGAAVSARRFVAYVACCALLAIASVLVLKLAVLVPTSVVFHATLLTLGLLALGDGGLGWGRRRQSRASDRHDDGLPRGDVTG